MATHDDDLGQDDAVGTRWLRMSSGTVTQRSVRNALPAAGLEVYLRGIGYRRTGGGT